MAEPRVPARRMAEPRLAHAHSACSGTDVHSHVVPAELPRSLGAAMPKGWPQMAAADACHRHVMIDGKIFRTVSDQCWSASRRVADLPAMGLARQVVSPMPELLSYWLAPADAQILLLSKEIGVLPE